MSVIFSAREKPGATDGDTRWVQVSARELEIPGSRACGLVGTIVDISAIKKAEGELRTAKAEAEAANRGKSEFLSTMSHELRTPLNAVIGLSESLLETEPEKDAARTRRFLELIHGAGQQLFRQVSDILDLARIEAGRLKLNLGPVEIGSLCATICESNRRSADEKSLRLVLERPADPLLIQADERLIGQALHNLVVNAVKFTPSGGCVTINARGEPNGAVCVSVADTGIGIPPDKLHLLFKPFTQVDSSLSRRFGGTGLGLVLVDKYIRLHGGSIAVKSEPVFGSTFTVSLPETPAGSAAAVSAEVFS
jgi:signal transduction histidine kinase